MKKRSVNNMCAGRFFSFVTMKKLSLKVFVCAASLSFVLSSCNHNKGFFKIVGTAQGTYFSVQYYDPENRDLSLQIDSLLRIFDLSASLWVENSTINRLNRGEDSLLDDITANLLEKSISMHLYTEGAFDCRVGKLVNAWGFGAKGKSSLDSAAVDSLLNICNADIDIHRHDNQSFLWKLDRRTEIDFNAIAQGFSVDLLAGFLQEKGIENFLIDIGGEVIAKGCKSGGQHWMVGIEKPADNPESAPQVLEAVKLQNAALVTSGNYRKYYEKDGVRYSHTIDPSTGFPVCHSLLSVSVIDSSAWRADALATAFMVMGLDKALDFIQSHHDVGPVFFIFDDHGLYNTFASPEMEKLIANK